MPASHARPDPAKEAAAREAARLERRYAEIGIPAVAAAARYQSPDPVSAHGQAERPQTPGDKRPASKPGRSRGG